MCNLSAWRQSRIHTGMVGQDRLVAPVRSVVLRISRLYEAAQVELQGRYSVQRLRELTQYIRQTSTLEVLATVAATPFPCLATILLLDITPLKSAYSGVWNQTYWLWFRVWFSEFIISICIIMQLCLSAPTMPMSWQRLAAISAFIGTCGTVEFFVMGLTIGFPTPFGMLLLTLFWFPKVCTLVWVSWKDTLRVDSQARDSLRRYMIVYGSEMAVCFLYPIYYYIFTLLSGTNQTIFSGLLPILKLFFKNWVSLGVMHMEDLAPTTIVFNIDVFHALFVSSTTQKSKSSGTTALIMVVDLFQIGVAISEIQKVLYRVRQLSAKIHNASSNADGGACTLRQKLGLVEFALHALDKNPRVREHPEITKPRHLRRKAVLLAEASTMRLLRISEHSRHQSAVSTQVAPAGSSRVVALAPSVALITESSTVPLSKADKIQLKTVANTLKILHMAEFYVLVEFVEVVMAVVYGAFVTWESGFAADSCSDNFRLATYLFAIAHLPNRAYYTYLHGLSDHELVENAKSVAIYAALEFASFVLICLLLERQLDHFSTIRQLAFVLRKHWRMSQAMLLLWILFVVQLSLDHVGTDYSLRFAWLHSH